MKILIVRFSSIGDVVLTTPVIRCLKQQIKGVSIHYITKQSFSSILESNPYIDKIYTIEKNISEVAAQLKKENYDLVIDLHNNLRSRQLKATLGKKSKSFSKLNIEKWLFVNLKINRLPAVHIVDRYLDTVRSLNVKNDNNGLDFFIPEQDHVDLATLPIEFRQGYVGFVIGAKFATKRLPTEKIISIIQKLDLPVILLGGKEDVASGNVILSKLTSRPVFNACGKYNLNQSASLVKQARKIISHDTGLMHIAAAFKKEIVSVWGNTVPEFGMYPYYGKTLPPHHTSQVSDLSCRPCSKLGFDACPKKHFKCMHDINEQEIAGFINS
jgi:ADP-heptose:LPS heptosyltransferase